MKITPVLSSTPIDAQVKFKRNWWVNFEGVARKLYTDRRTDGQTDGQTVEVMTIPFGPVGAEGKK